MDDRYRPTTDDIRTAWFQLTQNTKSFDWWLEQVQIVERLRAIEILDRETIHYGKTHSARTACRTCDIMLAIRGEEQ